MINGFKLLVNGVPIEDIPKDDLQRLGRQLSFRAYQAMQEYFNTHPAAYAQLMKGDQRND